MVNGKNKNKFYVNDLALIKDLFNKERDNILLVNNFVKVMASGSNVTNVSVPSKSVESTNNTSQSTTIFASNSIDNAITTKSEESTNNTSLSTTIFASNSIDNASEPEQNLNNIISTSSTNDSILNCYDPLPLNNFMSKPINDIILSLGTTQSSSCTCACAQKLGEVLQRLDKIAGEIETIKTAVSAHVVRGVDVGVNTCSSVTPLNALSPCTFNMLSPTASSFPISTSSVDLDLNHQTVSSSSFISLYETSSSSVTFTPALLNTDTVTIPSYPVSPRVSDCVNLPSGSSIPISQTSLSQPLVRSTEATPIALPVVNKGLSKSSDAIRSHVKSASRIESVSPSSRPTFSEDGHISRVRTPVDRLKHVGITKKMRLLVLGSSVISKVERSMLPRSSFIKTLPDKTINGAKNFVSYLYDSGYHFDTVCLQIGSNDIVHQPSQSVSKNYQTLVDLIRSFWYCDIYISGILPRYVLSKSFHQRRYDLNRALADFYKRDKSVHFVPQFLHKDQMVVDGVHPTLAGSRLIIDRLVSSIEGRSPPPLSLHLRKNMLSQVPVSSSSSSSRKPSTFPRHLSSHNSYRDALTKPLVQSSNRHLNSESLHGGTLFDSCLGNNNVHHRAVSSYLQPFPRSLHTPPLYYISPPSYNAKLGKIKTFQYETLV